MYIKNLSQLPFDEVLQAFLSSFEEYFVELPKDIDYWQNRFSESGVDWSLSFGMIEQQQLVAFIIHSIGTHQGRLTAYNAGTGVIPEFRGQKIIDALYDFAIPELKRSGIQKCLLEVIDKNEAAIRVYTRIGFLRLRQLMSFSGNLPKGSVAVTPNKVGAEEILQRYQEEHYCWDHHLAVVKRSEAEFYLVQRDDQVLGYFSADPTGNLQHLESPDLYYDELLNAVAELHQNVRIKNVPEERKSLISVLKDRNFFNLINQYEMQLDL